MITVSNVTRIENQTFPEYLQLREYSNSFFKSQKYGISQNVTVSDKMRLGSLVDGILLEPGAVDMTDPLYKSAVDIAILIRKRFGTIIPQLSRQVSYTSTFEYAGLKLSVKGRLDMELPGKMVIDLKVTHAKANAIPALIHHMGYDIQLTGYMLQSGAQSTALIIHSVPDKKTLMLPIAITDRAINEWCDRVINFGTV